MNTSIRKIVFASSNRIDSVVSRMYVPDCEIRGIVQIAHGMAEHIGRYADFCMFLAAHGYAACGSDHIGHGESVRGPEFFGFLAPSDGYGFLISDMQKLGAIVKNEFPGKPLILLGHSMGSFLARLFSQKYPAAADALIISGTSGSAPNLSVSLRIARAIMKRKGPMHRSSMLYSLGFGAYNRRIRGRRTDFDWLTRDESIVDAYLEDPACGFIFTVSGFIDLIRLAAYANDKAWPRSLPANLPILLISGGEDPVGGYGKGVAKLYKTLQKANLTSVSMKLYPGGRHEMLNELNRQEVFGDILSWIEGLSLKGRRQ